VNDMTLLEFVILFGFALVILGVVLAAIRLVRGPSLADRIVALDLMTVQLVSFGGLRRAACAVARLAEPRRTALVARLLLAHLAATAGAGGHDRPDPGRPGPGRGAGAGPRGSRRTGRLTRSHPVAARAPALATAGGNA